MALLEEARTSLVEAQDAVHKSDADNNIKAALIKALAADASIVRWGANLETMLAKKGILEKD